MVELNTPAERWLGILVPCIRPLVGGFSKSAHKDIKARSDSVASVEFAP